MCGCARVGVSTRAISVPADFHHPITITQLQLICDPIYTHPWSPLIVRSFWLMSVSEILCCSLVFLLHVPASCSCLFSVSHRSRNHLAHFFNRTTHHVICTDHLVPVLPVSVCVFRNIHLYVYHIKPEFLASCFHHPLSWQTVDVQIQINTV